MNTRYGRLLLWALAMLRVVGGLPYTWTPSEYHDGVLRLTRRRSLLAFSGLVVLYLTTSCIYVMITTNLVRLNQEVGTVLLFISNILANFCPLVLILSAFWKADKMANILRLISLVQRHTTSCSPYTGGTHKYISICLMVTTLCTVGATVFFFITYTEKYPPLIRVFFTQQEIVFVLISMLTLVIVTALLLEMTDLTERATSSLAGLQESQHLEDQMTLFENTFTNRKDNHNSQEININLVAPAERSLRALKIAARGVEDYFRIPFLLFAGEGFLNILTTCYYMTQSNVSFSPTSLLLLGSFTGRLWCAMHVTDIYKNKRRQCHRRLRQLQMEARLSQELDIAIAALDDSVTFTIYDFFTPSRSSFVGMLNFAFTYLIIALQFTTPEQNQEGRKPFALNSTLEGANDTIQQD